DAGVDPERGAVFFEGIYSTSRVPQESLRQLHFLTSAVRFALAYALLACCRTRRRHPGQANARILPLIERFDIPHSADSDVPCASLPTSGVRILRKNSRRRMSLAHMRMRAEQ